MNDRDELARELFIADNFNQPREQSIVDWQWFMETPRFAVRIDRYKAMAEGVIAAGYRKVSAEPPAWHHTPEPEGVQIVSDDTDDDGDDSSRWARTMDGQWKGYKNGGKVYLEWVELERRWGPITW